MRSFFSSSVASKLCWNSIRPPSESILLFLDGGTCSNRICITPRKAELCEGGVSDALQLIYAWKQCPKFLFSNPYGILPSLSDGQHYWKETELLLSPEVQCFSGFYARIMRCGVYLKLHEQLKYESTVGWADMPVQHTKVWSLPTEKLTK